MISSFGVNTTPLFFLPINEKLIYLSGLILISVTGNHKKKSSKTIELVGFDEEEDLSNTYNIYLEDTVDVEDNTALGLTKE